MVVRDGGKFTYPETWKPGRAAKCRRSLKSFPTSRGEAGWTDGSHQRWAGIGSQPRLDAKKQNKKEAKNDTPSVTTTHNWHQHLLANHKITNLQLWLPAGKEESRWCTAATLASSTLCWCRPACSTGIWCRGGWANVRTSDISSTGERRKAIWANLKISMVLHR